jgi:hypothetical protein
MISYHYYSLANSRTDPKNWESFFPQLDTFIPEIEQIEEIRKSLSPETRTTIDELGVILPDDNTPGAPQFPLIFWNAGAALFAYAWARISRQGIDAVGHSHLAGQSLLYGLQTFFSDIFHRLPRTTQSKTSSSISKCIST